MAGALVLPTLVDAIEDPSLSLILAQHYLSTHGVSSFPVLVRIVTFQDTLRYMTTFFYHEFVERIREVSRGDPS